MKYPKIQFIVSKKNLGYGKAINFAFKNKKETIGMLSYQTILLLHFGQNDLPETTLPSFGNLKIHTFAKLPQSAPRIITNSMSTRF